MIRIREALERGHADHGWLESYHTFSFAGYHDPRHMGFRDLRVINEDRVQPSKGFPAHSHQDMEIISYVLDGALEHRDSMGNGSVISPGDVQIMSAGTGVTHSEYNNSSRHLVHFLQIWILPDRKGLAPAYEQRNFPRARLRNNLCALVSRDGIDDSLRVHQDITLYGGILEPGRKAIHEPAGDRHAWVQVVRGRTSVNGLLLAQGDGAAVSDETILEITAENEAEFLLFDLA